MSLNTEVKNHRLIFSDSEKRQAIYITESKARTIRAFLMDRSASYIDLSDDDGNYSETIKKTSIKGVECVAEARQDKDSRWTCDYGVRHPLSVWPPSNCGCCQKYGGKNELLLWAQNFHGINHPHEITEEMRRDYLKAKAQ